MNKSPIKPGDLRGHIGERVSLPGGHVLLYGDAMKLLPFMEADLVITDPPYSAGTHFNARSNKDSKGAEQSRHGRLEFGFAQLTPSEFTWFANLCVQASRSWVVMTCDHLLAPYTFELDSFVRVGAWVKTNPMPQVSGDRPGQGHECILVLHSRKTKMRWNGRGRPAIWQGPVQRKAEYPTQKPEWLLDRLVEDFALRDSRQTILDPMMGSGTTGAAAIKVGHRFVGVESTKAGFNLAVNRLRALTREIRMMGGFDHEG